VPELPSTNIGKELLFENGRIRVWDMSLAPAESSELHHHAHDYLFVYVTPSRLQVSVADAAPQARRYADGYVQFNVVGQDGSIHKIRNVAADGHRQILVEFLGPSASEHPLPPETNGREIREGEA
jgi:hypothetical protein